MAKPPVVMAAVLLGLAVMTGVVKAWEPEPNRGAGPAERFTFGLWGDMPYAKNGDGPDTIEVSRPVVRPRARPGTDPSPA